MSILVSILNLLPAMLSAVQSVEAALPIQGAGKAKLDLVLGIVQDVYAADAQLKKAIAGDQLVTIVTSTVSRIVASFNALGIFSKSK